MCNCTLNISLIVVKYQSDNCSSINIHLITLQCEVLQATGTLRNLSSAMSSCILLAEAYAFIRVIVLFAADVLIRTI